MMRQAINDTVLRNQLAQALRAGQLAQADQALKQLLMRHGQDPALHHTAAEIAWRQGNRTGALKAFGQAFRLASDHPSLPQAPAIADSAARYIGHLLGNYTINCRDLLSRQTLADLLTRSDLDPQAIAGAAIPVWIETAPWGDYFTQAPETAATALMQDEGKAARHDPLALALLNHAVLADPAVEQLLLACRDHILAHPDDYDPVFTRALARQFWLTDYAGRAATVPIPDDDLLRALVENPADWQGTGDDPLCAELIAQHEQELALIAEITDVGNDADETAITRAQYEQHPYPRWVGLTVPQPGSRRALLHRAMPEGNWQSRDLAVLIAGCGTGRHALMAALGYGSKAQVTAIDISQRSLAYAERQRRRFAAGNLNLARADILRLNRLPPALKPARGYDVIECVGALHHMADTWAGLAALVDHLAEGGLIQLGLYRRAGRTHVATARSDIAERGLDPANDDDIRRYRRIILDDPQHPLHGALAHNRDFYSLPGCRDLLFHNRERDTDLTEIAAELDRLGLKFRGMQMPNVVLEAFVAQHDPSKLDDLSLWQQFEAERPDLFDAMYRFWVSR